MPGSVANTPPATPYWLMEDEHYPDDKAALDAFLNADNRAVAVHEAGHAVVARAVGKMVKLIKINFGVRSGAGEVNCDGEVSIDREIAVCLAGRLSEEMFGVTTSETEKRCGEAVKQEQQLLAYLPDEQRGATRIGACRLADEALKAKVGVVHKIACKLLARRRIGGDVVHIEGDELIALLDG